LKDLDRPLYISQISPSNRDARLDTMSTTSAQPQYLQRGFIPLSSEAHRSATTSKAPAGTISSITTIHNTNKEQDEQDASFVETPIETPVALRMKRQDSGEYRVHQSPERPVEVSNTNAIAHAHHSAPVESYHSPTTSKPRDFSTTNNVVEDTDIVPSMSRKNTDVSVSNFHIPGEFPKTPRMSIA